MQVNCGCVKADESESSYLKQAQPFGEIQRHIDNTTKGKSIGDVRYVKRLCRQFKTSTGWRMIFSCQTDHKNSLDSTDQEHCSKGSLNLYGSQAAMNKQVHLQNLGG